MNKFINATKLQIEHLLLQIGIPKHLVGSKYLARAIEIGMNGGGGPLLLSKMVYPIIALENDTRDANIERGIRHAIEVARRSGKIMGINEAFGVRVFEPNDKPTNSEIIALLVSHIPLVLRQSGF